MQLKVHEVKLEFYGMIKKILQAYTSARLLPKFKGSQTRSGHITTYFRW